MTTDHDRMNYHAMAVERFWSSVKKTEGGCWIWQNTGGVKGYGRFWYSKKHVMAHRFSYMITKGEIPAGMELDHMCVTPLCVNPSHLQLVTMQQNNRLRIERSLACKNGHLRTVENTRICLSGYRACRACHRDWHKAWKSRKALALTKKGGAK